MLFAFVAAIGIAGAAAPQGARAQDREPGFLVFGGGAFDIGGRKGAPLFSLEYIDERAWIWVLHPVTGLSATTDGSVYGYAGLSLDVFLGHRFVLSPSFAPGLYYKGGGKDLGHVIEFRSALKLAYRFDDRSRLGIEASHISNAGIGSRNPGAGQLMVFYAIPFLRNPR